MPAQPKPTKTNQNQDIKWQYIIWALVVLILIVSLLLNKHLALRQLFNVISEDQTTILDKAQNQDLSQLTASLQLKFNQATPSALIKGQTYQAEIWLNTSGKVVVGADAYLQYDPSIIKITQIEPGPTFPSYPSTKFNQSNGHIIISGISPPNQDFIGEGMLATIEFTPLTSGQTTLEFMFKPFDTRDSNVVALESASDILGNVNNLRLTIK